MSKNDVSRKEHEAVRNAVGFYDFTHQLLEVTGKDARSFLDKMVVNAIGDATPGTAKYTTMLNEEGIIIDDIIIFCIEDDKFWVSTLYIEEMLDWFKKHVGDLDVKCRDITSETSMWAVQGPNSKKVLNDMLKNDLSDLGFFKIKDNYLDDVPVKIARAGFTGELGYEIYIDPQYNDLVEKKLLEKGEPYGIVKITSDVILSSLPGEKGYVIMSDLKGTNPLEAGFAWAVDWKKDFVGKEALEKAKKEGPRRSLLGFTVDGDDAEIKPEQIVRVGDKEVGWVTKFTYGYTVDKNIGYALVKNDQVKIGDTVTIGDTRTEATLTDRVFYDPENQRVRG